MPEVGLIDALVRLHRMAFKEINSILASPLGFLPSLDYLVRPRQHIGRNRQTDLLSCVEIDDELELRRRFQLLSKNSVPLGNL
jgi:hypothetical protein